MIKVLIVDDHQMVRFGTRRLLEDESGLQIVGEASSGEEAIEAVDALNPQVVLMDVQMPGIGGLEATRRCLRIAPDVKVIALSMHDGEPFPSKLFEAGAKGYVSKRSDPEELILAIRKVMAGQRYISTDIAQNLALRPFAEVQQSPFEQLSGREMQIALMVIRGMGAAEMGKKLILSPKTVNSYRYRIFEKLDIKNDVELTKLAIQHGLLETESVA
ncbi:MAG TPA: two-component system response regulator UvrY [Gammaproteobacteria bacterium]|jgi:two-component system invasion response regulator UvrY|nr:UvrY/SirA/GacA family response regulator transcription factor [Gammaproteobacteria bacterium]MDA0827686.1 UvrY/SirA/GacA family response regulator transcription factor [Pseudomonadota bacterium]MDA8534217.1 UvrY/SirA/GacA family response regulator transcription factor [Pseudomonadales bacterium]MBT5463094.1 UvrY/SirA/GacA family response regulator transcription factor [Gammaproteobacteria bacterium]MBT6791034.1 UvrY/SirA/GacA family response regulator transcription factor [Gammaproteobacteri